MSMATRNKIAIAGVAYSPTVKRSERGLGALAIDACLGAIRDAGLKPEDIDGISNYPNPSRIGAGDKDGVDFVGTKFIAEALRLKNLSWFSSVTSGTMCVSLVEAANAVAAGTCTHALAWRGMANPPGQFGVYRATHAEGDTQFEAPYGLANHVMRFAFAYSQYMARYGATRKNMATYIVNCRRNAAINPNAAHFGKPITREDYMGARMIGEPLSILDCDMPVDGCGAVVVTTAERARDLAQTPVYVAGVASGGFKYNHSLVLDLDSYEESAALLARSLWKNSGLGPADMDFANVYDGFSLFVYIYLEAFGFCKKGEAHRFIQDGRIALEGALPVNPSGGAMGMGRLHGTPQLLEGVLQLQGRAGQRQLKKARTTLVNSGGPATGCGAAVLTLDP